MNRSTRSGLEPTDGIRYLLGALLAFGALNAFGGGSSLLPQSQ
jgi:hypothetical protein